MKKLTAILCGGGGRGIVYANAMHHKFGEQFRIVAAAEPIPARMEHVKQLHNIPSNRCVSDWKDLIPMGKIADCAIIATQDNMHLEPALALIDLGYDLILEKPIAPTEKECKAIEEAANAKGVSVTVCHVLRYTPRYTILKEILDSQKYGKVMSVIHRENVGFFHQAHSFVRGHWRNSSESCPMILAKSCHDMDILQWLLGKKCLRLQSFGSLDYFTQKNKPKGAPHRCSDGCPAAEACPYNADKIYTAPDTFDWLTEAVTEKINPTLEEIKSALRTGPYGRCVFDCDNDVVDHQIVNMVFEDNITVSFTMCAFSKECWRETTLLCTLAEIHVTEDTIVIEPFNGGKITIDIPSPESGHGGGDSGIITAVYQYLCGEYHGKSLSDITTSYENHLLSFAAEQSRQNGGQVIDMTAYGK